MTRRLRFSNAVYVAPARPLIEVAKQVATAAVLSEGRVSLGVGVGWMREEYELLGQDFDTRGKRLLGNFQMIQLPSAHCIDERRALDLNYRY